MAADARSDRARPPTVRRDTMDAADFEAVMADSRRLGDLVEQGSRLLPDFRDLLGDLFSACVKMTVDVVPADDLPPSAQLRRRLVAAAVDSESFRRLHEVSRLRPDRAGLAALRLGEAILAELRAGRLMLPEELRDAWEAEHAEEEIARLREEADSADALSEARESDDPVHTVAEAEARVLREQADELERDGEEAREALARAAEDVPNESIQRMLDDLEGLPDRLESVEDSESRMGAPPESGGGGEGVDALALGDELADNELLRRLARMVGALRAEALAERRKRVPRAKAEVYGVETGRDLGHLLPVELMGLRHPVLKRDFHRRFVEGELLTYAVRGDDEEGRGPAVICLDVSGSMAGRKGIWAKAMALVLADLARRDGRAVTVLTFSSGPQGVREHELVPDRRYATRRSLDRGALLGFAETRVGGGTEFAPPLEAAERIIRTSRRHRRADVVLVTDGEAHLDAAHLQAFEGFKAETETRCIGVLVDVADHRVETLKALCDSLTSVKDLTAEDARRVFRTFD
ncbi:MAG: VWA domain-containing protein [Myxococcota bacterium]